MNKLRIATTVQYFYLNIAFEYLDFSVFSLGNY